MVMVSFAPDAIANLLSLPPLGDIWQSIPWQSPLDWSLLAQQFETDVFADTRDWFQNFIESGQVWALLIGFILGYMLRSFTSYG
jgi:hypothetical protein